MAKPDVVGKISGPSVRIDARSIVALLRPRHWIKNLFVLAPVLFSGKATSAAIAPAIVAFLAFCLAASFAYAVNDVFDAADDRKHPDKRGRPVAIGALSATTALIVAAVLGVAALALAFSVNWGTAMWVGAYLALNIGYSRWLKHIVLLDLFAVAACFMLRLLAGSIAVGVHPSTWLLLCGGLLALYLAVCKRREEITGVEGIVTGRPVLAEYSPALLDQIAVVLIAATFLSYCEYSLISDTAQHVGGPTLAYGTPFVLYGLLRYHYLVHRRARGNPMDTLFTDRALLINITLWVAMNGWALYRT